MKILKIDALVERVEYQIIQSKRLGDYSFLLSLWYWLEHDKCLTRFPQMSVLCTFNSGVKRIRYSSTLQDIKSEYL